MIRRKSRLTQRHWGRLLPILALLLALAYVGVSYAALSTGTPSQLTGSRSATQPQAPTGASMQTRGGNSQSIQRTAHSQPATPGDRPQTLANSGRYTVVPPSNPASVLYDQYSAPSNYAEASQNFEPGLDVYDAQSADDFVVPAGNTWLIDQLEVAGAYRGSGLADSVNVYIYADDGGIGPGTPVITRTNLIYQSGTNNGDLIIPLNTPVTLAEGVYWLSVQANQDYYSSGQWLWRKRLSVSRNLGVWRNPLGGFYGYYYQNWGRCSSFLPCYYDLMFRLDGRLSGTPVTTPTGTPLTPTATRTPSLASPTSTPPWPPGPVLTAYVPIPTPACGLLWRSIPVAPVGGDFSSSNLKAVSIVSASDIWAVGSYYNERFSSYRTLIEHWNGSQWTIVSSPNPSRNYNYLNAVTAVSANDVWAVGYYVIGGTSFALIEHWNGSQWSVMPGPNLNSYYSYLNAVTAVSANDVWAVGYYYDMNASSDQTLIEHWNGSQWSVVSSPNIASYYNYLYGVSALSANNVWAVGYIINQDGTADQTLIEHWDGSQWSIVTSPDGTLPYSHLYSVSGASAKDVWAVGNTEYYPDFGGYPLVLHWNGSTWTRASLPTFEQVTSLYGVTALSATNVWAVGHSGYSSYRSAVALHWDGAQWNTLYISNEQGPNSLSGIAALSSDDLWAVGYSGYYQQQALAKRYYDPCASQGTPTTVPSSATLVGHVTWQGRPAQPHPLQQVPITLTLKLSTTEVNYPLQNTDTNGYFTTSLSSLVNGTYNWRVKDPKYLANSGTVTLAGAPVINLEMGLMRAGDANNDNLVTTQDFIIVKTSFGTGIGDPGYDDRADFNGDHQINASDFTLLKVNFGMGGAPPVSPLP